MTARKRDELGPIQRPAEVIRTLPHNLEAERSVLGAILLHNDAFIRAADIITAPNFFRDAHRRIFEHLEKLNERGVELDLVTVKNSLINTGELEEVGGPAYLSGLLDGVPRSLNVVHYANIIKEKAQLRALIFGANRMLTAAFEQAEDARDILAEADSELVKLMSGDLGELVSVAKSAPALLDDIEKRYETRGQISGVTSGLASLDDLTDGWQRGDYVIVAARPSMGKTSLVLNMATAAARQAKPDGGTMQVGIFSLEMKKKQLERRMLSSLSGVMLTRIQRGLLQEADWGKLSQGIGLLTELAIHIDDSSSLTTRQLRARCRKMKSDHGLDLVIIDYIQLMDANSTAKNPNRVQELTQISRALKKIAGELDVPVIVLSQLSRAQKGREKERPQLSDLRECGALEQDADVVLFIHRNTHKAGGHTRLIIEKARNGPTGEVAAMMDRDTTTFTDGGIVDDDEPDEKPETDDQRKQREKVEAIKASQRRRKEADRASKEGR